MTSTDTANNTDVDDAERMIGGLAVAIGHAEELAQWWRSRAVFHTEDTPAQHAPAVADEDCERSHPDRTSVVDLATMRERWKAEARDAWTLAGIYARRSDVLRQARADASEHLDELTRHTDDENT
jgi:hypothetical protein